MPKVAWKGVKSICILFLYKGKKKKFQNRQITNMNF